MENIAGGREKCDVVLVNSAVDELIEDVAATEFLRLEEEVKLSVEDELLTLWKVEDMNDVVGKLKLEEVAKTKEFTTEVEDTNISELLVGEWE